MTMTMWPELVLTEIERASKAAWQADGNKHRTPEAAQRRSDAMVARVVARNGPKGGYCRTNGGRRPDIGDQYFRSSWEANYARYLTWRVSRGELLSWEYEPKTFEFSAVKRGTRTYTPDFLLHFPDGRSEWHEVKGWMDPKSKTRLSRMAKYFPDEVVRIIGEAWFRAAAKSGLAGAIPGWERKA
jgi:hypothetical protein